MIETIKIENKEVRLDNNVGWTLIYRDQFGQDVLPSVMPMLAAALDVISGVVAEATENNNEVSVASLLKAVDGDTLTNAMIHIGTLEFVDFLNITWSLAKNADDSIPEPKEWIKGFDEFPIDVIAPAVGKLVFKGMISSKNLKRLNEIIKSVQPTKMNISTLTQSSSPESNED